MVGSCEKCLLFVGMIVKLANQLMDINSQVQLKERVDSGLNSVELATQTSKSMMWRSLYITTFTSRNVAKRMLNDKESKIKDVETPDKRKKINKFKESAWKMVYFLSATIFALLVTYQEPWFTNTKCFWEGPGNQVWPDQKTKLKLKALYMYVGGFYTYSIFALIFWETRRKDFSVSMSHHVASVLLIGLSYVCRFTRGGSLVMAVHDATDAPLEFGKIAIYSGYEKTASVMFALFVLAWTLLRITYYPFWLLYSTSYESVLNLDKETYKVEGPLYYYVFNTLLYSLLVLNVYWWVLMLRMVVAQIRAGGQVKEDVRSDSEGEDEHED
ncbi:hypothetical protein ACFE04_010207 [Oxalis oulophora]